MTGTPTAPVATDPSGAGRVAVIGDVGGHLAELRQELIRLGADAETGRLPDDLTVVQVGDLVHRGPESAGVVALVDGYLRGQPGRWRQIVGNHEAQYLRTPAFSWPERVDAVTAATLQGWWADGLLRPALAVEHDGEEFLITHAGLTRGYWEAVLDGIDDAAVAAAALNSFVGAHEDVLFHGGQMLGGGRPDPLAGPVWAAAGTELLPSWLDDPLPFSQVHGHSSVRSHLARRTPSGRALTHQRLAALTSVDEDAGHEETLLDGGRIVGVDPGHGVRAQPTWRAWELGS